MIEAKNLTMHYGATRALNNVSFRTNEREIIGLLGPNGAGKTTLMRILTTFIYPTKGTASICGYDITENPLAARKILGYLPENPPLYIDMRVDEYLDFVGRSRGLYSTELKRRKEWVIEATQIREVYKHTIFELSLGYRQRVGLAQALIHDPRVIILDEPTSGLDPMQIIGIRKLIRDLSREKTIIFSTHILQEASAVSDRLLIIDQGQIIAQGTTNELKKGKSVNNNFLVSIQANRQEIESAFKTIAALESFSFIEEALHTSRFQCLAKSGEEFLRAINQVVKEKNWTLKELSPQEPSLEEVFLGLFKKAEPRQS
ncbi:MAG: ATP-binding cassette domain-containing protein [Candidatus Omnitrophota bacterium]